MNEEITLLAAAADPAATENIGWVQTIVLSIVQGLTEFLPISSSGHLRIISELFWGADAGASFTAVVQLGTEAAVLVFFAKEIWQSSQVGSLAYSIRNAADLNTAWAG